MSVHEKSNILVIDDERRYRDLLELNLERHGYKVVLAVDGLGGLNLLEAEPVDLVLLDLLLPDLDGFELCRRIRHQSHVPIIMLTDRSDIASKVRGLRLGADDYVTKPFSAEELMARIYAVLRRCADRIALSGGPFVDGELAIDYAQHRATMSGQDVQLTRQEYKLLECLAQHVGRVVVHDELLRRVWGPGYEGNTEILHTTVRRLRRKLQDGGGSAGYVQTWRSIGYQLTLIPAA